MNRLKSCALALTLALGVAGTAAAAPTVFPTGVTIYNPEKAYNGYTLLCVLRATPHGLPLIDMNGNVVNKWMRVEGQPAQLLPNGNLLAEKVLYDPDKWTGRLLEGIRRGGKDLGRQDRVGMGQGRGNRGDARFEGQGSEDHVERAAAS